MSSISVGPDESGTNNKLTFAIGSVELTFYSDGRVFFNGRQITDDIDLVNGMRDLVGLGSVHKVMEE